MLNKQQIQECIIWACEQEVQSPKPGNVNSFSDGHNMQVSDFIKSAHAIAPALTTQDASVGQRILLAIQATQNVVNCNTNLGIVLLFAPLCVAIEQCNNIKQLRGKLSSVLENLSVEDAVYSFQAIRLAHAGGLGKEAVQDISTTPTVTLLHAMEMAKDRDSIAAQYLNNYHEIFEIGLPKLTDSIICGETVEWATTFAYLYILSSTYDTLICRKQGEEIAKLVSIKAKHFTDKTNKNNMLSRLSPELAVWDKELKRDAINPGTTADLTATSLLLHAFSSK